MTEFRPGGFQTIPTVIKNLIILNLLVFIAQNTLGPDVDRTMSNWFALHDVHSVYFKPHQLVTYLFLHGSIEHIFFNMFALWMFGAILENYWGMKRFLIFYMICGIGAGICQLAVSFPSMAQDLDTINHMPPGMHEQYLYDPTIALNGATVGASGAIFGCLAAFGYLFPNSLIYLYFFVPIKVKWFVIGYAAIELWSGLRSSPGDNVAHWAHLGGGLVGLLMVMYWNRNNRRNFY